MKRFMMTERTAYLHHRGMRIVRELGDKRRGRASYTYTSRKVEAVDGNGKRHILTLRTPDWDMSTDLVECGVAYF